MDISDFETALNDETTVFYLAQPGEKGFVALDGNVVYIIQKTKTEDDFELTEFLTENVKEIKIKKPDSIDKSEYSHDRALSEEQWIPDNISKIKFDFPTFQESFTIQASPQEATLELLQKSPHVED